MPTLRCRPVVVETGIIVAGAGYAGSAILRKLAEPAEKTGASRDPAYNAPYVLLDKTHGEMLLDVILTEGGEVAGALIVRDGEVVPMRAPAVVLATGGFAGLFPGHDWRLSGDGLAIAHRAGLEITRPVVEAQPEGPSRVHAGVPCAVDGGTRVKGLFVAGGLGADRPKPEKVARAAVLRARGGWEPFGPYHEHPTIDDPLPKGFAAVKFARLQSLCAEAFSNEDLSPERKERLLVELHRLKGEADEYARARTDVELFSLQNACEVALLLLRGP